MKAVELADSSARAQKQAAMMGRETVMAVAESDPPTHVPFEPDCSLPAFNKRNVRKCYFCVGKLHANRRSCSAVTAVCHNCSKRGHFAKVCKSKVKDASDDVLRVSAAGAMTWSLLLEP